MKDGTGRAQEIGVEVVFATPDRQVLLEISLAPGATVADAIAHARDRDDSVPPADALPVGIWGRRARLADELADGDRVELYRPLRMDPREARRRYAAAGLTMGTRTTDRG